MNSLSADYGDFFGRKGREGLAESAAEVKEEDTKPRKYRIELIREIENGHFFIVGLKLFGKTPIFGFPFLLFFLRPVLKFRALCVQKLPVRLALRTNYSTGAATQ